MKNNTMRTCLLCSALILASAPAFAENGGLDDLGEMSLESLGEIVTSVSKKPEDSFRSAAAIHVVTNEDIKLSGATHIAEALRMVPGMDVARIDSSNWAISSRGFNGSVFANKLLVLVDGRTIYTPLLSGVYWDIQNLPLEDVERIEVIRGPGASLWGANAVNGIINIITKDSADTQGVYASTLFGNEDRNITDLRYGGKLSEKAYFRTYAKYENRDSTETTTGADGGNRWFNGKAGFRSDWTPSEARKVTVQGDVYDSNIHLDLFLPSFTDPTGMEYRRDQIDSRGFNLLGRWEEKHREGLQSAFQAYVDYQSPTYSALEQDIYTFDFDYQTAWEANARNDVMWGVAARAIKNDLNGSFDLAVLNDIDSQTIFSAFLQDQIALLPKELYLTLGSKVEKNSLIGYEIEPSARIAWYPDDSQTLWASVSHAVRAPGILEHSSSVNVLTLAPGVIAQQQYNTNFNSEDLIAYELGHRIKPLANLSFDSTVFMNDYKNLATFEPGLPVPAAGGAFVPFQINNLGSGRAYGFETSATWDVTSRWDLMANYSYLNLVLEQDAASLDPIFLDQEGNAPHHQFMLRSQLFLPRDVRLVNTGYYVDELPSSGVDDYFRFDTQIIWKATEGMEFSLVGQNLLDGEHSEFGAPLNGMANEIPRAFYGRITLRY